MFLSCITNDPVVFLSVYLRDKKMMMQHYIRMSSFEQGRGMSAFVFLPSETILLFYELQKKQALLSLLNDSEEQAQR